MLPYFQNFTFGGNELVDDAIAQRNFPFVTLTAGPPGALPKVPLNVPATTLLV